SRLRKVSLVGAALIGRFVPRTRKLCRFDVARNLASSGAGNLAGVITVARFDGETFTFDTHFDVMEVSAFVSTPRNVRDSVLVARFFRDAGIQLFEGFAFGREIDFAAGIVSIIDKAGQLSFKESAGNSHAITRDIVMMKCFDHLFIGNSIDYFSAVAAM